MRRTCGATHYVAFFLAFSLICLSAIKLNVPRVLLPFSQTVSANFSLEVTDGGCFNWYVSRPEVVRLHLLDEEAKGCSSKAVVTSTSRQGSRQSALVIIRNEVSGEVLHCDVTVASIHELEITTTTRELLLEDTPEAFTLRAKDKEGDTFSSIDGLVFDWNLVTDTGSDDVIDAHKVLRFLKFSESLYESSLSVYNLEAQGLRGYTILVQGIKTGTAIARATLRDAAYPHTVETEVALTVIANLVLWPAHELYVLVGSLWTYEIHLIQHGKSHKIKMPSDQYYLTVTDERVAVLDRDTCEARARSTGYTTLLLKDRNVKVKQGLRQPSVGIHVVEGHRLGFAIVPRQTWYLVAQREYIIVISVFDAHNNELHITDNWRMVTEFSAGHFDVIERSENGTFVRVITKKAGQTTIRAELKGIVDKNGFLSKFDSPLKDIQELEIVEPVAVEPVFVIMPWHPLTKPSYRVDFKAFGGGGYGFHWKCSNLSVATCDATGGVTTKTVGSLSVTATSMRNLNNFGSAMVTIQMPDAIEVVAPVTEVQLGGTVHLGVRLYADVNTAKLRRRPFTDCTNYPFVIEISEPGRLEYLSDAEEVLTSLNETDSCATLRFLAIGVGMARVEVKVATDKGLVYSSVGVGVYKPLTPVSPESLDESVLLTVGSSTRVVMDGGPKPHLLASKTHFRDLQVEEEGVVSVTLEGTSRNKDRHVFTVLCTAIGQTMVILRVGNNNTSVDGRPSVARARVPVICDYPTAIQLHARVARPKEVRSVCFADEYTVVSQCYRDLDVDVILLDDKGNQFRNHSSLVVILESSDPSLALLDSELVTVENTFDDYTTLNRSYMTLRPKNLEGALHVTATVSSYRDHVLRGAGISPDLLIAPIVSSKLFIELVEDAVFVDALVSVFNHPLHQASVAVFKGSGHFDYDPKDLGFADITFDEKSKEFHIVPKSQGSFVLTLIDTCLDVRSAATTSVHVSGISSIDVRVVDKVSIGEEVVATVQILDQSGHVVPSAVFPLLQVKPHVASEIVSIRSSSDFGLLAPAFHYFVKGVKLGLTSISFTVDRDLSSVNETDSVVSSRELPVQVFSPLRLSPVNVTLIVGAVFQLSSVGGPHPQGHIEFDVKDSSIASIIGSGIIEGRNLGMTTVVGRAVGIDSDTGESVVYSKHEVYVRIVPLTGIRIKIPLTRIRRGAMMPVYAVGIHEEEIPFAFASAVPSLTFSWSSNSKEVVHFEPLLHQCGIMLPDDNHFATRVFANQAGQVALSVKVYAASQDGDAVSAQVSGNDVLTDEVQIHIFDELRLISPALEGSDIVITPETKLQLLTNKERTSTVHYFLTGSSCLSTDAIIVERNGLLRSGKQECHANLVVTAFDDAVANQTVSVLVTVKRISYMMSVVPECAFRVSDRRLHQLPVGAQVPIHVRFYDNAGKTFTATNSRLKFRPSRFDLLRIEPGSRNDTFNMKVDNPGFTVVHVWDVENVGVDDYFVISSGEVINPSRPTVLLGDLVCFTLVADYGGRWHTDDRDVVTLHPSGLGIANNVGSAAIVFNVSNEFATWTELSVLPVRSIEFDRTTAPKFLTNAHLDKVFHFPLILKGDDDCGSVETVPLNTPFDCVLQFAADSIEETALEVFTVWKGFDTRAGRHECLVKAKIFPAPLSRRWSTLVGDVELSAVIYERTEQEYVASDKLKLPFFSAFHVHTSEVQVGDVQPVSSGFTVSAAEPVFRHLSVKSNDSVLIDILPWHSDPATPDHYTFPVQMNDQFWRRVAAAGEHTTPHAHIEIFCSLTEQSVRLPVRFITMGDKLGKCVVDGDRSSSWSGRIRAAAENYSSLAIVLASIFGTLVAVFIGYHATVGQSGRAALDQSGMHVFESNIGHSSLGSPGFVSRSPNSTGEPQLWSVHEPVRGSPIFSRAPSPRFAAGDRYMLT